MKSTKIHVFLIALLAASFLWMNASSLTAEKSNASNADHHKVYELRTYTTYEGKLDALHKRFADHTMALFEKHGMENIGYWTPTDQENTLIYIVAHDSREAAEESWESFRNDPDWQKAYEASHKDGPIVEKVVSVFMTSTDFSPMK